jgi:broad specificity phosphatase PhoE
MRAIGPNSEPTSLPGPQLRWSDGLLDDQARIVAVRHGETQWSALRRHTGRTDIPLEPAGEAEAVQVGKRLAGHQFSLVISSPLRRARRTCELAGFGASARVCDDLAEWDYGDMEGKTTDEIRADRPGWDIWTDGVLGGESLEEVANRADRVVALVRGRGGDVLAFAHAHILRVIAARWLDLDPGFGRGLLLAPATISILGWERENSAIVRWNDGAGDPFSS